MSEAAYQENIPLHHPKSFWTKWVFSQDHKVIAIQYTLTAVAVGLIALVMSWMMRSDNPVPENVTVFSLLVSSLSVTPPLESATAVMVWESAWALQVNDSVAVTPGAIEDTES